MSGFGAEKDLFQGHGRKGVAHAFKCLKLPKSFQQSLYKKGETGAQLVVANFSVRFFILEVRSQ